MRALLLLIGLLVICSTGKAQYVPKMQYRDTIFLRGYIYDHEGKPVSGMVLRSRHNDTTYGSPLLSETDANGYFAINGAMVNDTLTIERHFLYKEQKLYNKGSRYMVIYLPLPNDNIDLNADKPITVAHIRQTQRIPFIFQPPDHYPNPGVFSNVQQYPHYKGETAAFLDSVRKHLIYPHQAVANNIAGMVKISFLVDRDGTPRDLTVLNGLGYGCDQAVMDAIRYAGKWEPAKSNGRATIIHQTITVEFKLTDK